MFYRAVVTFSGPDLAPGMVGCIWEEPERLCTIQYAFWRPRIRGAEPRNRGGCGFPTGLVLAFCWIVAGLVRAGQGQGMPHGRLWLSLERVVNEPARNNPGDLLCRCLRSFPQLTT